MAFGKTRIEAFSDGVIAIIITIMVLELKTPHSADIDAITHLGPVFLSYLLSFIYVGIYWNNHHHMLHAVRSVDGAALWANLHLLFWLSLIPFVTSWMGENHFAKWPVVFYGVVLIMNAIAYTILSRVLIGHHGRDSDLAKALGTDTKGKISLALYAIAIVAACFQPSVGLILYFVVAMMWLIPDRRIEKQIAGGERS
jgi:uncharacterized membrane protein